MFLINCASRSMQFCLNFIFDFSSFVRLLYRLILDLCFYRCFHPCLDIHFVVEIKMFKKVVGKEMSKNGERRSSSKAGGRDRAPQNNFIISILI